MKYFSCSTAVLGFLRFRRVEFDIFVFTVLHVSWLDLYFLFFLFYEHFFSSRVQRAFRRS